MDHKKTEQLIAIINKVTGGRATNMNLDGNLKDELSLDSIQVVELFARLEKEFDIELPLEMMTVKNGKEFLAIFEKCLQNKG